MPRNGPFGWIRTIENYPIVVASGTSAEEYLTDLVPGFQRILVAAYFISDGSGAGASASRLIRIVKGASTVAASRTLVLANTQTIGLASAFTLSTTASDYQFYDADTLTIDVTAAGTQFTTLTGTIKMVWKQKPQQ